MKKGMKKRSCKVRNSKGKILIKNIALLFILFCAFGIMTNVEFGKKATKTDEIIVKSNDTIWNIASDICQEKQDLNVQNVILEIRQINQLTSSNIYAGQVLSIPIY